MPLLIPIPPVQELLPEELEPLKDALLAHLRSQNAATRDQVDRNLHVTSGERIPAYSFSLHALLETRDAVPVKVVKPCTTEAANGISSPPAEVPQGGWDVWSFPSEERNDFTPYADTYFIPNTRRVDECRDCYQKGELGCKACMGKGVESCSTCLGAGRQSCVFCKGSEKVNCLRCGGEGRLASGEVGGRSATCDACGSTGKFKCTHCKEGKVACAQCRGSGNAACQKCKGQGKIPCVACGGQKKIMSGQAFHATFRPFQVRSTSLAEVGPREALEMALEKTTDVGALTLSAGESLESQFNDAVVPNAVRSALYEIVEREKAQASTATRVVKRRLDLAEGSVVRIRGYCGGQEFSFWISPGTNRIVAEKDPMAAFGSTAASSAEDAREAGDWKKALALARESLSYSPTQPGARQILGAWRRKVAGEALLAGVVGGMIAAAGFGLWIGRYEKGLHKAGAMVHAGGLSLLLGPLTALALIPVLLRVSHSLARRALLSAGILCVLIFSAVAGRWSSENPIRLADQAALASELNDRFKYGIPQVYYEPDLRFLQNLVKKYKDTQVDLTSINEAVSFQISLRAKLAKQQEEFETKIREILYSDEPSGRKRARLTKLTNEYRLMGVDLKSAEKSLQNLPAEQKRGNAKRAPRTSRISITSGGSASPARKPPVQNVKPTAVSPKKGAPPKSAKPLPLKAETKKSNLKSGTSKRWWE